MYLNIRGIKSKLKSLNNILDEVQPTIVCITETHLIKKEELKIDGYEFLRNDRNKDGGGVLVGIDERLYKIATIVERKKEVEEALWIVIDNTQISLRIGVIYAPQESRTTMSEYIKMYESINEQILIAKQKQQKLLLMGDFNCKVGNKIIGNSKEISKSGKNFLHMIKSNKLEMINGSEKCSGLWTREEGGTKSVLDYMLINKEDETALIEMTIDEEREYAPRRDDDHITTSDHNTIIAKFNWLIDERNKQSKQQKKVITAKGYSRIRKEINDKKISRIWEKEEPFENLYYEWKQQIDEIVERNSTEVKKQNKRKTIRLLIKAKKNLKAEVKKAPSKDRFNLVGRIKVLDEQIKKEDQRQFTCKINKVVERLRGKNGLNVPNMWEIVKRIKKKKEEPITAIKSKDGVVVEDQEGIKARYLEHFIEILKIKPATTEKEKDQEDLINLAFSRIMQIAEQKETILTKREEVSRAVEKLKRKKCKDRTGWNNEIILESGEDMIDSLTAMMNRMEIERTSPKQWSEMKVKAISKIGSALLMDDKRGLFISDVISKVYETVMKNRNEEKILNYISDFQNGGVKKRSPGDCLFLLSEIIRIQKKAGKKCYLVFGDAVKCFDKLWLKDALVELFKAGCEPQDIQMMFKMNENTVIEVETPCGTTEKATVGEIVKQGTILGPTLCCISTDQINKIGETQERCLGKEYMAILIFVDDVMSAGNPNDARKAIRNFREMEDMKKFTYGLKKTKYMVMKTGKEKEEIIDEEVNSGKVSRTVEYKYVGFHINEDGNCLHHIEKKSQQIEGQITALKSIANHYNLGPVFVQVRIELYNSCIIPSLLYGLETWHQLSRKEVKNLEKIQAKALCQLLELPRSTPYMGILSELGMWRIEERLDYRRIMLLQNLLKSDDRRLCKRVVLSQRESEEEGTFYDTTKKKLEKYDIDLKVENMTKSELKKEVKRKIDIKMGEMIGKAAEKMTKLRFIAEPRSERKGYITTLDGVECLHTLKTRLNMLRIYGNYKGDSSLDTVCCYCKEEEDKTEHLLECKGFGDTLLKREDLKNADNHELWKLINERTRLNIKCRAN